jgi:arylsulfatase A-like enzyme
MESMQRRDFIKVLGLGAACAAMPKWLCACGASENHPNIVFILADDMGYGDLACQNPDSKIPTPHLDSLAKEGVRFTDAHSPSAVCTPTRYGLLTGRYAWRTPLKSGVLWPWDGPLIEQGRLTVGGLLKKNDYTTACIGKWHLGWDWSTKDGSRMNDQIAIGKYDTKIRDAFGKKIDFSRPARNGPVARGFDYYFGDDVPNFPPYCFIENDHTEGLPIEEKPEEMFGHPGPMRKGWKLDEVMPRLTQKAVDFIKAPPGSKPFHKAEGRPFFLYFSLTAPHTPIAPAEAFKGKSKAGGYGDFVHQVDWTVGQVMKALEETGQAGNTLLIFTSDNGSPGRDGSDMNGAVNSVRRFGHNPSHIYRGIKADVWDGGHRVPFIARWPRRVRPGSVCDEPVCHVDLMATCAAILGQTLPAGAGEDSHDILPALMGQKREKPIREAIIHHSGNGMFAVRQGKWKLILGRGSGGWSGKGGEGDPHVQLYDMAGDPSETKNLCNEHPDIVKSLSALLEKYRKEGRSAPRGAP